MQKLTKFENAQLLFNLFFITAISKLTIKTQYICIFMPFPSQVSNQFTKITLDENLAFVSEQELLQDVRRNHFFSESIQPSLKELQDFGLLPENCLALDHFAISRNKIKTKA